MSCVTDPQFKQWGVSLLDDVRVPKANLIGQPGRGLYVMGGELDQ